jgi:hypothetical protein
MQKQSADLKHTVAFKVTEKEWGTLHSVAKKQSTTVPQLAKRILFAKLGLAEPKPARSA